MTYNPVLQRWEGNEAVLREFDKALTTSTRPALISPFSSTIGAPHRGSFAPARAVAQPVAPPAAAAAAVLPPGATTSASRGTAKVVGDMVFDPATCSWHAVNGPDAEDELELDWGGGTSGGEAADDEDASASGLGASSDVDGWELGERERMLKNRASFVLEEGSDEDAVGNAAADLSEGDGTRRRGHTTKRQMWRESQAAAGRSLAELGPWRTHDRPEDDGRRWLWELRAVRPVLSASHQPAVADCFLCSSFWTSTNATRVLPPLAPYLLTRPFLSAPSSSRRPFLVPIAHDVDVALT